MRKLLSSAVLATALLSPFAAFSDTFKVATTFTVIADMAQNVAGDAAEVVAITKPGAEIHFYQPTPQDILNTLDADLILWNGMNLELWFERFFTNMRNVPAVVVTEGITPLPIASGAYEGKPNPHAWMGFESAMIYVDNIAAALSTHDPDNAEIYAANARAYKDQISQAIAPLKAMIDAVPEDQRWLVSSEGAFSYLAQDLGLKELYIWPMNSENQGTPQQLRSVIDTVRANNIPVVFSESTIPADAAKQVAAETDATYGGVLYVDSLSEADGPVPTYLDLLRVTTQTIAQGLQNAQETAN